MGQLRSELAYAQVQEVIAAGLHEFLDDLQRKLNLADDAIADTFFGAGGMSAGLSMAQS